MLETLEALTIAWQEALDGLGVTLPSDVVVGGRPAEAFADAIPLGVADGVSELVTLGGAPSLGDGARPAATGLPNDSVDACVMLEAWTDAGEMSEVVAEARRVTRPGGAVWLGAVDFEALGRAGRSIQRASLAYQALPRLLERQRVPGVADLPLALLRGGLLTPEVWPTHLPIGSFGDPDAYVTAALNGMWVGTTGLSVAERSILEREIRRDLRGVAFPVVEYQPWVLARGTKPS